MSYNINPESLLKAAELIAEEKCEFICIALASLEHKVNDAESRYYFMQFLRDNNITTSGLFRESGKKDTYYKHAVRKHRVLFTLMLREMILDNAI